MASLSEWLLLRLFSRDATNLRMQLVSRLGLKKSLLTPFLNLILKTYKKQMLKSKELLEIIFSE